MANQSRSDRGQDYEKSNGTEVQSNKNHRGNKNRNGKKNYDNSRTPKCQTQPGSNDVKWYVASEQLLKDVASFNFSNVAGLPIDLENIQSNDWNEALFTEVLPGIMTMRVAPILGVSNVPSDPVNIAMYSEYAFVRSKNSGAAPYDAADMMLYLGAMDSIYAMWAWVARAYGRARFYESLNTYLPAGLFSGDGIDIADVQGNLTQFRSDLNTLVQKINTIRVPAGMPIFMRHMWLFMNTYLDKPDPKAQMYQFTPAGYYVFERRSDTQAGRLKWTALRNQLNTRTAYTTYKCDELISILREQIDAIINNQDFRIMSGDINKAYDGKVMALPEIDADFRVAPIFNEEVLGQIHNATVPAFVPCYDTSVFPADGMAPGLRSMDVDQDTSVGGGHLVFSPRLRTPSPNLGMTKVFNSYNSTVSAAEVMVNSRLAAFYKFEGTDSIPSFCTYSVFTAGSELIECGYITAFSADTSAVKTRQFTTDYSSIEGEPNDNLDYDLVTLSAFDWHPIQYLNRQNLVNTDLKGAVRIGINADIMNFTTLPASKAAAMNKVALMGEYNVSTFGAGH